MTVPVTIADLSVSEGSNSPLDSDSITAATRPSDYIRAHGAIIRTLAASSTLAAGATTDLSTVTGTFITLTGVATTITALGTLAAGLYKFVIYNAAHTITHNATSLILLGGASRTVAAGDSSLFLSEGAGNWREVMFSDETGYQPLDSTLTAISGDTLLPTIADGTMGAFSHRNKIINGGFAVNQRAYVSGAATTASQYTLDRWKVTGTGGITFSTTANKTTVTIPSGQALQQVVEGLNLQSGTYVLSWEGTAQGKIGAGSYGASGVTGSITGGTDTTIEFGPGTVANVQLEVGSVVTPFEHRPYGAEMALCQRYYEIVRVSAGQYNAAAGNTCVVSVPFKVSKRATPTVSTALTIISANVSSAVYDSVSTEGARFVITASSSGVNAATVDAAASIEL